ncbi:protein EURL homolog [Pseudorasbora parva]|uniref:protein EURL homolog n=1 Tax=Pseudorasbora parva TaxID=51549 RepID=UPI00351EC787
MEEEEQFVNIDLNDDNICSICKLETDTGTLSFCHVCFELSIEGVSSATLLHSKSLRGHRDCFEKYHLIANQNLSRSKASQSGYEGMKRALSQRIGRILQNSQSRASLSAETPGRWAAKQILGQQPSGRKLVPQSEAQVPRYTPRYGTPVPDTHSTHSDQCQALWAAERREQRDTDTHTAHTRDHLVKMSVEDLRRLNEQLLLQIQSVFEQLSAAVQEKDSLSSELHVRHIAIEQLFKNCAKLPWLQIGRAGVKGRSSPVEGDRC